MITSTEAAQMLGAIKTPKKTAASRENAAKAAAAKRTRVSVCTCKREVDEPLKHKSSCPIYNREYRRRRRLQQNV